MSDEAPPNKWETPESASAARAVGVYGGGCTPGTYLKTATGVQRGEELFHRPELERPWRTTAEQRHVMSIALREKEIEALMRKCSSLRTKLGNAKHEAKCIEFAMTEKSKEEIGELRDEVKRLEGLLKGENEQHLKLKETMEHQLRMQKLQHEKEQMMLKNECRVLNERVENLTKIYQQQVDDVKKAAAQELDHVESLCNARVEELTKELEAVRATNRVAEERHTEGQALMKNLVHRIESEYKERSTETERRIGDMRARLEDEKKKLSEEREEAVKEAATAAERLVLANAASQEVEQRFKQWDIYILRILDDIYSAFVSCAPEQAVEPHSLEVQEAALLYAPRCIVEDPEAKLVVERIVTRLLQLKTIDTNCEAPVSKESDFDCLLAKLDAKQERLSRALVEIEGKCSEASVSLNRALSRLYFFCDDLENAISHSGSVPPPQRNVVFACLRVFNGDLMWVEDAEKAQAAVSLMNCVLRPKMAQYGAYECYCDGTSMLLAFDDPVAACRFCTETQKWLMTLPWSQSLLESSWGSEVRCQGTNEVVFRGLRLAMAVHTGDTFVEPLSIPVGDSYRCHYYGRAVSQTVHACSTARGGQILVSQAVWERCGPRKHELGALVVRELGVIPTAFFDAEKNSYEKEPIQFFQVFAETLKNRSFNDAGDADVCETDPLGDLNKFLFQSELKGMEGRCVALKRAISAAQEEFGVIDGSIRSLTIKVREAKSHFQLIPPVEMVMHLNNMYTVMERIALRASELRDTIVTLERRQEDLSAQTKGLRSQCSHMISSSARLKEIQIKADVIESSYREQIRGMTAGHREKVEQLHRELQERDQKIRDLCRNVGHVGSGGN
ncbi:uncharacterized protein TEOVI_000208000 [Trypanosoma equiperdum]|uniref:adenylate cyclase n=3 Tax=Trypanozoon TaxID=39700 RepID=Q57Z02_TRYB2|nr:hypothetical protein, conserved [Trypanosoma brucei brucei TREU927]AAX70763.1 hypothetical protein, conserved [Trypanosoma brucei]AAX80597.1 hypothetical protein, conserved [Trypanosoma brucei]AAZ11558.1 hypothetical protein, conserved [Trypanosoma brucei brucei TREU927]SCU70506.1 hypothetical protein, conserved [Trypanosoma equiperdum]